MKEVKMFQSDDGTLYKTETEARKNDTKTKEVDAICKLIGGHEPVPCCGFTNGDGYFQLSSESVAKFDAEFEKLVRKYQPWIAEDMDKAKAKISPTNGFVARCISDSDGALWGICSIRMCIDSSFRRWGQPYYANNPSQAKNVKLGDL